MKNLWLTNLWLVLLIFGGCGETEGQKSIGGYIVIAAETEVRDLPLSGTLTDNTGSFDYTISEAKGNPTPDGAAMVVQVGFDITVDRDMSDAAVAAHVEKRIRREFKLTGVTLETEPK